MIIAFDVDDVLADLVPAWLARYNKDYDDSLSTLDLQEWDVTKFVKPECGKKIYDYLTADLYDDVKPIQGALEAVQNARNIGQVVFCTSTLGRHAGRKLEWLNEHGFDVSHKEYIECGNKGYLRADVLIDDCPKNLIDFQGDEKVLVSQTWNWNPPLPDEYARISNFGDQAWWMLLDGWKRHKRLQVQVEELLDDTPGTTKADLATKAVKYDGGKPRMELLSPWVIMEVAKVMTYGCVKYQEHNWRNGFNWTRPIGASLRHITAWLQNEDIDPESGLYHLAHAMCGIMFTLEHQLLEMGKDDRWKQDD